MTRQIQTETEFEIEMGEIFEQVVFAAHKYNKKQTKSNHQAYNECFNQPPFFDFIYRIIRQKVKRFFSDPNEIEDLCQDILIQTWKTLHQFH